MMFGANFEQHSRNLVVKSLLCVNIYDSKVGQKLEKQCNKRICTFLWIHYSGNHFHFLFSRAFKRILCCQRHWGSSPRSTANNDTFRSSIDHTMPNSSRCLDMNPNSKSHKYIFKLNFIETCWKRTSVSHQKNS